MSELNHYKTDHYKKCEARSNWHFDTAQQDQINEWFYSAGKVPVTWKDDLTKIKNSVVSMDWSALRESEKDLLRYNGGNPDQILTMINDKLSSYDSIQSTIQLLGLENSKSRIHIQMPGQAFNWHFDTLDQIYPSVDPTRLIRMTVMLEDWIPGQYYIYGTYTYQNWKAGDVNWFKWMDLPHGTANASLVPRCSLIVTGIKTDITEQLIKQSVQ